MRQVLRVELQGGVFVVIIDQLSFRTCVSVSFLSPPGSLINYQGVIGAYLSFMT
jgi:hypothetical protein